jgi:Ni,Fe-hydrogenase I cytochrome b subunit
MSNKNNDGGNPSAFVTWKDFNTWCAAITGDIASLKTWQKIIIFLLSSNVLLSIYNAITNAINGK